MYAYLYLAIEIQLYYCLQSFDQNTDITYQVCADGGGGAISIRDFVYLRHWDVVDGVYVCAMISTKHSSVPTNPKRVRYECNARKHEKVIVPNLSFCSAIVRYYTI